MSCCRYRYPTYELKSQYAESEESADVGYRYTESEEDTNPYLGSEEGFGAVGPCPESEAGSEDAELSTNANPAIEQACVDLRSAYSEAGLSRCKGGSIDFSQDVYQKAYLGRYVGMHLTLVATELYLFWEESAIFRNWVKNHASLNVCSIGGGPGTDIIGIILFFQGLGSPNWIEGTVFDMFNWERMFKSLLRLVDSSEQQASIDIHNVPFDFFDFMPKSLKRRLRNADMVTMIKFVSVVMDDPQLCMSILQQYFVLMKPGAMFFFVDNSGGLSFELVAEAAEVCDMRLLARRTHDTITVCPKLIKHLKISRNCCANCNPQRYTKVSGALYQKI